MNPFNRALRELWVAAGRPSLRSLSTRSDHRFSHTTLSQNLRGTVFPRWNTAVVMIEALRGDPAELRSLWDEEAEAQEQRRQARHGHGRRRPWRIATGVVIRPGDTLVFTVPQPAEMTELEGLQQDLVREFPRNKIQVVGGAQLAVIREEEAA